VQWRTKRR